MGFIPLQKWWRRRLDLLEFLITLEGDVSDVIALDQLTSPFSPRKATRMSP